MKAGALSGGERQMVAMGRALMMEPSVLLLDEPSAGLSPMFQDEVFIRCQRINATGVSIIMVEQNARRCLQICDRGYVLDQGRNAYTDTGADADARPEGDRAVPRHPRGKSGEEVGPVVPADHCGPGFPGPQSVSGECDHPPTTMYPSVVSLLSAPNFSLPYEPMDGSPAAVKSSLPVMPL